MVDEREADLTGRRLAWHHREGSDPARDGGGATASTGRGRGNGARVLVSRFGGPAYWKRESPYCTTVRQGPRRSRKMCQPARFARWIAGDDRPLAEGVAAAHRMS